MVRLEFLRQQPLQNSQTINSNQKGDENKAKERLCECVRICGGVWLFGNGIFFLEITDEWRRDSTAKFVDHVLLAWSFK